MTLIIGSYDMNIDSAEDIKRELQQMMSEERQSWESDVVKRTVSKLLSVEKKALYGEFKGKNKALNDIIDQEFCDFMDE